MLAARPRALPTYLHINPMRNLRIFTDEDLVICFKLHNSPAPKNTLSQGLETGGGAGVGLSAPSSGSGAGMLLAKPPP